jgi:hypothetical protein
MCTLASAKDIKKPTESDVVKTAEEEVVDFFWWLVGKSKITIP